MIAQREIWNYPTSVKVWVGKYKHSHNLLHWHYDCELLYVEKGSIDVFCERHIHTLSQGQALYIDRGQMHYMTAREQDTTLIVIVFDYEILKPYMGDVRLTFPCLKGSYPIPEVYTDVRNILLRKQRYYNVEATARIMLLMSSIFRGEEVVARKEEDDTSKRFMQLLDQLTEKYERFSYSDAVSFMGMSEGYFSRYFRSATGLTFSRYLNYLRIERAIKLMRSGENLSMTELADRCGFDTIRNFNRVFRSVTGFAPRELPADYLLDDNFVYPTSAPFNPTLYDCELLESPESLPSSPQM